MPTYNEPVQLNIKKYYIKKIVRITLNYAEKPNTKEIKTEFKALRKHKTNEIGETRSQHPTNIQTKRRNFWRSFKTVQLK